MKKIVIWWIVSLMVVFLFSAFMYYSKVELQKDSFVVEQNAQLSSTTQNLLSSIQKLEIISMRLALSRSQKDSLSYTAALNSLQKNLVDLEMLFKGKPQLKEYFFPIKKIISEELFKLNRFNSVKRGDKDINSEFMIIEEDIYKRLNEEINTLCEEEEKISSDLIHSFNSKLDVFFNYFLTFTIIYIVILSAYYFVLFADTRRRIILTHQLLQSKKELDIIINTVPAMVFALDVDNKHTLINKSYLEFLNLDKKSDKEEGLAYADRMISMQSSHWLMVEENSAIIENEIPINNIEREVTLENGRSFWLNVNKAPLFDENDNVVGIIGVMDDITKRIEFQNALIDARKKLEELNKHKDRLFSIIGHDLRSPFTGILGYIEILSEEYSDLSEEDKKLYINNIQTSLKDLTSLIENLLMWAKLNIKGEEYNPRDVSISKIVNSVMRSLHIVAKNKKINLHSNVDGTLNAYADPDLLETTIRNLVSNSIKFTNPNGSININAYEDNNSIVVEIEDNGMGMHQEIASNLFKLDSQVIVRGTNNEKGTGLGLIICKKFVEKHGGKISVKSKISKGTIVSFNLPKKYGKAGNDKTTYRPFFLNSKTSTKEITVKI